VFEGNVSRFPFEDHNPCQFQVIEDFCLDVHQWLSKHPQNIAAVHCKAGKGRTGLMIACYMVNKRATLRLSDAMWPPTNQPI
jgi:phosphatidylinositol-3,4,5-trisphosphate 3-phosphatase/dual-specificity protein phosphatase PTEN